MSRIHEQAVVSALLQYVSVMLRAVAGVLAAVAFSCASEPRAALRTAPARAEPATMHVTEAPPVAPWRPVPGELAFVADEVEGLWTSGDAPAPPDAAQSGLVRFLRGASRRVVESRGEHTLLEVYPADETILRYDRGLAWVPTAMLRGVPVMPQAAEPHGELAYLKAQRIEDGPTTRCGHHRILSRKQDDEGHSTELLQVEDGVELHGWVEPWELPRIQVTACVPRVRIEHEPATPLSEAMRRDLIVPKEHDLGAEFAKILRSKAPLFVLSASVHHGLTCETLTVTAARGSYMLLFAAQPDESGGTYRAGESVVLYEDPNIFGTANTGLRTFEDGRTTRTHFRCGTNYFRVVEISAEKVVAVSTGNSVSGPDNAYAVSRASAFGWFRTAEACDAERQAFERLVGDDAAAAIATAGSRVTMVGGGC